MTRSALVAVADADALAGEACLRNQPRLVLVVADGHCGARGDHGISQEGGGVDSSFATILVKGAVRANPLENAPGRV